MLQLNDTALVLIDVQGKLAEVVHESEAVLNNITKLIKGVQVLGLPIIWMEQYPKGLGTTAASVQELLEDNNVPIAKMNFSACDNETFQTRIKSIEANQYLIAGIEAHICVYQTVQGLLNQGFSAEIVQDAVSSRTLENKQIAIKKMIAMGAQKTSVEMALFELLKSAEHPRFKEISHIIK